MNLRFELQFKLQIAQGIFTLGLKNHMYAKHFLLYNKLGLLDTAMESMNPD
jgi:hypothetical protein